MSALERCPLDRFVLLRKVFLEKDAGVTAWKRGTYSREVSA